MFYRPNDQETAEYLERCLGRKSDFAHSQTIREGAETSEGRMEQGIPLMTAQEIKQMADEMSLGFTGNYRHSWQSGWMGDTFRSSNNDRQCRPRNYQHFLTLQSHYQH